LDLAEACEGLTQDELSGIMDEFSQAKAHCQLILENKLSIWSQLPWRLCALADWSEHRARAAAIEVIEQFNRTAWPILRTPQENKRQK